MSTSTSAFGMPFGEVVPHVAMCPDCDASALLGEVSAGIFRLTVLHDETCPTWRNLRRNRTTK